MVDKVKEIIQLFFEKLLISVDEIEVKKEGDNIYNVSIKTSESWLVIWPSWTHLTIIRNLLRSMLSKVCEERIVLHLEINDYMEEKDKKLFGFIKSKVDKVNLTGEEIILPFFSSYERKKIHAYIWELWLSDISTKSVWEWKERRLHISKKGWSLWIDIDGIWI